MGMFHLAIPSKDLEESKNYYGSLLKFSVGREYPDYVIFDFFGHQLVCHLDVDRWDRDVRMYPRHYGFIFKDKSQFDNLYEQAKKSGAPFYKDLFERFREKTGWHWTFFLIDPSNNLIEFKYYHDYGYTLGR